MLLELISGIIADKASDSAVASVKAILLNERAFDFAREKLRDKYAALVGDASYEHIAINFRLFRQDFTEFFLNRGDSGGNLRQHLRQQILSRTDGWVTNRPEKPVLESMVDDFLLAMESYYVAIDHELATLKLVDQSNESVQLLSEIRELISKATREGAELPTRRHSWDMIGTLLTASGILFSEIEQSQDHVDVQVIDSQGLIATTVYMSSVRQVANAATIDNFRERAIRNGLVGTNLLISEVPISAQMREYAMRRGITSYSLDEFRATLWRQSRRSQLYVGSVLAGMLLQRLGIDRVYVRPHASLANPGPNLENRLLADRRDAINLVQDFLSSPSERLLFVLGGYGSGKSAFLAYLTANIESLVPGYVAVYVSLGELGSGSEIISTVERANRVALAVSKGESQPLILLDAIDEVPDAMDLRAKRENLLRIVEASAAGAKLIVTVRTSYFRGLDDFWDFFSRDADHPLWRRIAGGLTPGLFRPNVAALVLSDLNTDQIADYLVQYGSAIARESGFAREFLEQMKAEDPRGSYRRLARNPLYLSILVDAAPWRMDGVESLADVLEILVKYWLNRDIAKGASRWTLTVQDRMEFNQAIVWYMHNNGRMVMPVAEFEQFIKDYFGDRTGHTELQSIALDLQATGLVTHLGGLLHIALQPFADYFVACGFCVGAGVGPAQRTPTPEQAEVLLGLIETKRRVFEPQSVATLLTRNTISQTSHGGSVDVNPRGVLYGSREQGWNWPVVNGHALSLLRQLVNASYRRVQRESQVMVPVRFAVSLHARPAHRITVAYSEWRAETAPKGECHLIANGRSASMSWILELMCLCTGPGEELMVSYHGCSINDVELLLQRMGGVRQPDGIYMMTFGEVA
jgi:phosphotransferase system HPr-like phosphotransfer protein